MEKLKTFLAKVTSTWFAIGAALATIGATGFIAVPEFLVDLFSADAAGLLQALFDALFGAAGAFIAFYQFVRALFASKEIETIPEGEVQALALASKKSYAWNPFRIKFKS